MAGVSSKEIKNRIRSMQSTRQITKAMEMVATAKLCRTQAKLMNARPYFETLHQAISEIVDTNRDISSQYLSQRPVNGVAWIVITGDRGLAGGYNSNVLKLTWSEMAGKRCTVLPIGKKAADFFRTRDCRILSTAYEAADNVSVGDCFSMAKLLCKRYSSCEYDAVRITYTKFTSALSLTPVTLQILPLVSRKTQVKAVAHEMEYEPDCTTVFDAIVPEYIGGMLYGALCESRAAEQAARRIAMDSASKNANEMIDHLSGKYNRARQAAITSEIIDIVAGA